MSINALVIPEDFRKDQFILKPVVERMLVHFGVRARVQVCMDPLLGGVGEALKWNRIEAILNRYRGMVRLFLLIVDRDCDPNRRTSLDTLEARACETFTGSDRTLLAENAWQELEVWVVAGATDLPNDWPWSEVRADCDPKERFYLPYTRGKGVDRAPYEGREALARAASSNYGRLRQLCPEDIARLEQRVQQALTCNQST